ncbi:MAG: hypothetical protein WBC69_15825 [Geitlerinemataceae cyanobacterium]
MKKIDKTKNQLNILRDLNGFRIEREDRSSIYLKDEKGNITAERFSWIDEFIAVKATGEVYEVLWRFNNGNYAKWIIDELGFKKSFISLETQSVSDILLDFKLSQEQLVIKTETNSKIVEMLQSFHQNSELSKDEIVTQIKLNLQKSNVFTFIHNQILSKLDTGYEKDLILYQININVGDTCKHLALIKSLCIQHNKKAIVFYPKRESPMTQARLFLDPIMPRYVKSHFPIDVEIHREIQRLNKEDEIPLDRIPVIPGIPRILTNIPETEKLTYITDQSIYEAGKAASLGISIDLNSNTLGKPIVQNRSLINAEKKFIDLNLSYGQSILLAPHSVHMNSLTGSNLALIKFWQKIINELIDRNLVPVLNSRHREASLDDDLAPIITSHISKYIKLVDLSLDEVIPFVEFCGSFAGTRSGLCDLIAFSKPEVTKLCIEPRKFGENCFSKLSGKRVIDDTLINENFHFFYVSVENPPEDEQIQKIVSVF